MRISPLVMVVGVAGCSSLAKFHRSAAPVAPVVGALRPIPYPVFETHAFARAVARGTRTRSGEPGANYWQQYAHYSIDAELVPTTSRINGRETVRYFNRSPDTLSKLWIELDQNLFAPSSPRVVATPVTGGTEILRVAASGQALASRDTGVGYSVYETNMELRLPRALAPHDSLDLDIAWAFQLPPDGAARVSIQLASGEILSETVMDARGSLADPLSDLDIEAKLHDCSRLSGTAWNVNVIIEDVWRLDEVAEHRALSDLVFAHVVEHLRFVGARGVIPLGSGLDIG